MQKFILVISITFRYFNFFGYKSVTSVKLTYMKYSICVLALCCLQFTLKAQVKHPTGVFTGPFESPLLTSTSRNDIGQINWDVSFQSLHNTEEEHYGHIEELKAAKIITIGQTSEVWQLQVRAS